MSNRLFLTIVLATACLANPAPAEPSVKIATVNIQEALNQVEQGRKAKELLKSEFDQKQKKLDLQQEDLKKMRGDLDKKKLVLSSEALQEKEQIFSKKYLELQKDLNDYRQEIVAKEARFTAAIIQNLRKLCGEVGKEEGYDLVVETSQDAVLYADAKEDLTERIIKLYNQKFKGPLQIKD